MPPARPACASIWSFAASAGCARHQGHVGKHPRQVHRRAILEHSRIVCFGNGFGLPSKKARVFISSADWMGRNLSRRVETLIECLNETVKDQITSQVMAANMADEAQSWLLQSDGRYLRYLPAGRDDLFSCHRFFMENPSLSGRGTAGARQACRR